MRIGRRGRERRNVMEKGRGKGTDTLQTDKVFTRKEYIERETAVMKIREWFWSAPGVHPKLDRDVAEDIMFAILAADVVPVRRGHWEFDEYRKYYRWYCSCCLEYRDEQTPFCPSCGAKMD